MFECFTEKAIKVIMLAQEEARRLGHNFVDSSSSKQQEFTITAAVSLCLKLQLHILKSTGAAKQLSRLIVCYCFEKTSSQQQQPLLFKTRYICFETANPAAAKCAASAGPFLICNSKYKTAAGFGTDCAEQQQPSSCCYNCSSTDLHYQAGGKKQQQQFKYTLLSSHTNVQISQVYAGLIIFGFVKLAQRS
ncbi:Double Clp-N motif-containing protein [Cynara cardunculus var. scolymus]|uniref:Double Clp-N motif-containing protein n=1 Tax=Cynara cardunculus var. scolymus TaxID=59895 RepID=A0A103YMK7_CYNCS|nr:Double Clp-N motif-containing protein [Cynara cardunculus var. scolymus]